TAANMSLAELSYDRSALQGRKIMKPWLVPIAMLLVMSVGSRPAAGATPDEKARIEQGRQAVRGRPALSPAIWPATYESVWKQWGAQEKPADYATAFRARYGLHKAPYDNDGLPMGLHTADSP